jgi:hypothetical protein
MAKTFFSNVSEKALQGIRNMYAGTNAKVSSIYDPATGEYTVVVVTYDNETVAA